MDNPDPKESALIASAVMVALEMKLKWKKPSPSDFGLTNEQYDRLMEVCHAEGPGTSTDYIKNLIRKYTEGAISHASSCRNENPL